MKYVSKVETYDGMIFDSVEDASEYLQELYKRKLSDISNSLTYQNPNAIETFIHKNINQFADLIKIENDMVMNG